MNPLVCTGTFWSSALPADDASSATDDRCAPVRARLRQILVQRAAAMLREEVQQIFFKRLAIVNVMCYN